MTREALETHVAEIAAAIGESDLYAGGPGTVIRCRNCDGMLVVITQIRGMACVDVMGIRALGEDDFA